MRQISQTNINLSQENVGKILGILKIIPVGIEKIQNKFSHFFLKKLKET